VRTAWPFLFLGLIVAASFSPLLFFGYIYFDEEQLGFYYPQSFFYAASLRNGSSLAWNNAYYGGVSVSLDQFVSSFYPLHRLLFQWLPFVDAHHISIVLAVLAGCFLAYWFGRASGFCRSASLILALSYLLATTFEWLDIGTLAAHSFLVLPALFLSLKKISSREHSLFFFLLGGASLGIGFLAGFVQIIFYQLVVGLLWALFLDWSRAGTPRQPENGQIPPLRARFGRFRCLLAFFGILAVGSIVGGRQIFPSVFFIDLTVRSSTFAIQNATQPGIAELLTFIFPAYVTIPSFVSGVQGLYAGALPFLAVLFGLALHRTRESMFFLALYGMVFGFGFHLPVFAWLNEHIPPFSHMSGQARWLTAGTLPLSYLAAQGFETILERRYDEKKARRWLRAAGWLVAAIIAGTAAVTGFLAVLDGNQDFGQKIVDWSFRSRAKNFPNEHYLHVLQRAVGEARSLFSFGQWRLLAPLLLLGASFFVIRFFLHGRLSRFRFTIAALLLAALNVVVIPVAVFHKAYVPGEVLLKEPEIVKELKKRESDPDSYRVAGFLIGDSLFWNVLAKREIDSLATANMYRELLINNMNVLYGIQRLDGMEPYRTLRHNRLLNTVVFPGGLGVFRGNDPDTGALALDTLANAEALKTVSLEEKMRDFGSRIPLLSMSNVKYIYSLVPLEDPRLKEIPVGPNSFLPVPLHLYQNKDVMPRLYLADRIHFFSGKDTDLLLLVAKERDFRKNTFIECARCPGAPQVSSPRDAVDIRRYENGLVEADVSVQKGRWLVFGESAMPGWVAAVDGVRTPFYRANYLWQAVPIPPGEHRVELKYHDITALTWNTMRRKMRGEGGMPSFGN
jgi:hypothetical protein